MAAVASTGAASGGKSMEEVRQESAVSMEGFIKHHMMVILQPFIDHVQTLDERLHQLSEHLAETDSVLEDSSRRVDAAKAGLADLKDGVIERTNGRVQRLQDMVDQCAQNHERLSQWHDETRGHVKTLQNFQRAEEGAQPEMQRNMIRLEEHLQACQSAFDRTSEDLENNVKRGMKIMAADLQELKTMEGKCDGDLHILQAEVAQKGQLLQETREVLDKTSSSASSLQRHFQDMLQREAQMGARVEGWKHQWSKINPAIDALRKEAAALKQRADHQESVVHGLQQGYATTFSCVEALDGKHARLRGDVDTLKDGVTTVHKGLDETRDGLGKATTFTQNMHTALERTAGELCRASQKLESLESRHDSLTDHVEKTSGSLAELAREHRNSIAEVHGLQQDIQRTNDSFSNMKTQMEATSSNLHGVRSELGRTNEAVQRLDHGVELCHAGFSGLQKGFQETGTHMSTRPITLPKLPPGGPGASMRSPRNHDPSLSTMTSSTTTSWRGS